jgi:hypothetical protein
MRPKTEEETKEELEGATEIFSLDVTRVDGVENPATKRGFLIIKAMDEPDDDNKLVALDPQGQDAFNLIMNELKAIRRELQDLRAADRTHANSLLKSAPVKSAPVSRQVAAGDTDTIVSKTAGDRSHLRMRTSFANVFFGGA